VVDQIKSGYFNPSDPTLFEPLVDHLLNHDTSVHMHLNISSPVESTIAIDGLLP
jgi:hypothetical protein